MYRLAITGSTGCVKSPKMFFLLLEFESDKRFVNSACFTQCDVLSVLFYSSAENKMWDFSGWRNWNLKLQVVRDGLTSVRVNAS